MRRKLTNALAAFFLLLASPETFADSLTFLTHSVGDQTYRDAQGELRGKPDGGRRAFNIELAREMMTLRGAPQPIEVVPLKRGLAMIEAGPGVALFNINRTAEREPLMKWVGPLQSSVTTFYENRHAPTRIASVEDARKVDAICVLRDNVHHRHLEKAGFDNLYPANSYDSCVRMLARQRVSLTPLSNLSSIELGAASAETTDLRTTAVVLMESEGYLVFSRDIADAEVARWQDALDHLKASGRYDELVRDYLGQD